MRAARTVDNDTNIDSAGRVGRRQNTHARDKRKCTRARQLARGGEREPEQKEENREKKKMVHQFSRHALKFGRFSKVGRELMRNENSSLPQLQRKVIIGRVTAKDKNGYYSVDSGFKGWGEGNGEERHDPLWTVCQRPLPYTPLLDSFILFPLPQKNLKRTVTPHTHPSSFVREKYRQKQKQKTSVLDDAACTRATVAPPRPRDVSFAPSASLSHCMLRGSACVRKMALPDVP